LTQNFITALCSTLFENVVFSDEEGFIFKVWKLDANKCIISKTTVHEILVQELHMNRICARWVPRMLSEENMTNRTEASRQFLRKFSQSGIGFLDRIITTIHLNCQTSFPVRRIWCRGKLQSPLVLSPGCTVDVLN
jgi:hypothetical protein